MSNSLSKVFSILQIVLLLISALVFVLYFFGGSIDEDIFIGWSYILLGVAGAATLLFSIANIFTNFKSSIKSIAGFVILLAIVGISFLIAADSVEGGIITMYILLIIAVVTVVFTELSKIFR